jgi:hypothetical protein
MQKISFNKYLKFFIILCVFLSASYGIGRLYYRLTGGFMESNITSDLAYNPRWKTSSLSDQDKISLNTALEQRYIYLGKGCQSYVFLSQDGKYVIKFFKYQRFRPRTWFNFLTFIPAVENYQIKKVEQKKHKLESIFNSWKIAYENLRAETGIIYLHLNKSKDLNKELILSDKLGLKHSIKLDDFEFLIQKRADMLCSSIRSLMKDSDLKGAESLISRVLTLVVSEYERGFADNDHALMQNTGVINGIPIHIDVGQFVKNERVKNPAVYRQELFNKTYKFKLWLEKEYPELGVFLQKKLLDIIGDSIYEMKPYLRKGSVGVVSPSASEQ